MAACRLLTSNEQVSALSFAQFHYQSAVDTAERVPPCNQGTWCLNQLTVTAQVIAGVRYKTLSIHIAIWHRV